MTRSTGLNHLMTLHSTYITEHLQFYLNLSSKNISTIHLFTITTTSDKSISDIPKSIPALIQIQAIHDEEISVVIRVEIQHFPHRSTPLFQQIQQLCHTIFSRHNKIMVWGNVISELRPFASFSLFDLSHIMNHLNPQTNFTHEWNKAHPHTFECANRYHPVQDDDNLVILLSVSSIPMI
ncbi:unnamed protein product [Rotaria magnacalcarata]|uniref:Uncharacterized protein n=1 Tax=Rotaria magnacalcarata TaxID=392030 RepID=A0A816Y019_9BILA|nr:unnamed protein product [Rotaria magnacalcarata]